MILIKKLKWVGYIITVISFTFIIKTIIGLEINLNSINKPIRSFTIIIILSSVYFALVLLVCYAWKIILEFINGKKLLYRDMLKVYVRSNIAKYLPGNVMHFAGRNFLGVQYGLRHSQIVLSSMLEIIFTLLTVIILSFLLNYKQFISIIIISFQYLRSNVVILFLFVICVLIVLLVFQHFNKRSIFKFQKFKIFLTKNFVFLFAKVFLLNSIVFVMMGLMLALIYYYVINVSIQVDSVLLIVSAFVLAWFAGFVVPGAPGGIGVRESILILILSPIYGHEATLLASFIHRLVSILGDVIAFIINIFIDKNK